MSKKQLLDTIVFNVVETFLIFGAGLFLIKLSASNVIIISLTFMVTRAILGEALHFKDWKRCLIWSLLILTSLFLTSKFDIIQGVLFGILSAYIMTGKAKIYDIYLWGGNPINNEVFEWVKYNQNNEKLQLYEEKLKEKDKKLYYIFVYRFREFRTYRDISEKMEIDEQRIAEYIKLMYHYIEYEIRLG